MNSIWSFRGGLLGMLLGVAFAMVVLLARYPNQPMAESGIGRSNGPSQPTSQGAPPIGGSHGGNGSMLPRIARLQLSLNQIDEAVETISAAPSPFDVLNFLNDLRHDRLSMGAPAPAFGPAVPLAPITSDSFAPAPASIPGGVAEADPGTPTREFILKVLDRLDQRLKRLPPLSVGDDGPPLGPLTPDRNLTAEARSASRADLQEQAEVLLGMADLYQAYDEPERAKKFLGEAQQLALAAQQAASGVAVGGSQSPPISSEVDSRSVPKTDHWGWLFATVTTVVGTILGGVFKPVLEAYGKGVIGRAFAEAIQSPELAAALELKLNSAPSSRAEQARSDEKKHG